MFEPWQWEVLKTLKTPEVEEVFARYGDFIPLEEITEQEREIIKYYYLKHQLFLYDDIKRVEGCYVLGYTKRKSASLILDSVKRHRAERNAVVVNDRFADLLPLLHSHDELIEGMLQFSITKKVDELFKGNLTYSRRR